MPALKLPRGLGGVKPRLMELESGGLNSDPMRVVPALTSAIRCGAQAPRSAGSALPLAARRRRRRTARRRRRPLVGGDQHIGNGSWRNSQPRARRPRPAGPAPPRLARLQAPTRLVPGGGGGGDAATAARPGSPDTPPPPPACSGSRAATVREGVVWFSADRPKAGTPTHAMSRPLRFSPSTRSVRVDVHPIPLAPTIDPRLSPARILPWRRARSGVGRHPERAGPRFGALSHGRARREP